MKISNNGMVKYYHRITLNAQCLTNIEKWPFDSHNCSVLIGSPLYKNNLLNYNFLRGPDVSKFQYYFNFKINVIQSNRKCTSQQFYHNITFNNSEERKCKTGKFFI